jgi:HAD superfamily hydrolase (TIGR01509 family)
VPKRKYSVIVFDLGNVLLPFNYELALEKLNKIDPGLGSRFWKYYEENYHLHRGFERGDITEEDFLNKILAALENRVNRETFFELYSKIFTVNEDVAGLLPELKKKYMLVLLSNTNSIHQKYGWNEYEFLKLFDKLILSHEVNALKPEPAIYKKVEAFTRKPPEEHIFIDDIEEYAESAKKAGWEAVWFKNYENLVEEFKERKIL